MTLACWVSVARIALTPLVVLLIWIQAWWLAFVLFSLLALTDWLDGWIARRFNQTSDLGKWLDPLADKALVLGSLWALALLNHTTWWLVVPLTIITLREVLVTFWRGTQGKGASWMAKSKTVAQIAGIGLLILTGLYQALFWPAILLIWIAMLLALISAKAYFGSSAQRN